MKEIINIERFRDKIGDRINVFVNVKHKIKEIDTIESFNISSYRNGRRKDLSLFLTEVAIKNVRLWNDKQSDEFYDNLFFENYGIFPHKSYKVEVFVNDSSKDTTNNIIVLMGIDDENMSLNELYNNIVFNAQRVNDLFCKKFPKFRESLDCKSMKYEKY